MGAACCKKFDSPTSPHLPFSEVLRRCARQMCPLDPPRQKTVPRARKYGLSDIVGPVLKKDNWSQTDPLPPPRRRKKKSKRRRSRSVEFLPTLLNESTGPASLEKIAAGLGDDLDPKEIFICRLLSENHSDLEIGFLTGLLGEENNNQSFAEATQTAMSQTSTQSSSRQEIVPNPAAESNSRKSSITESLKEFESSLLDMLQDVGDEDDDLKPGTAKDPENQKLFLTQPAIREGILTSLKDENEQVYVLTPLEEEEEDDIWNEDGLVNNFDITHKKKERCKVIVLDQEETKIGFEREKLADNSNEMKKIQDDLPKETQVTKAGKKEPPTITVETVS